MEVLIVLGLVLVVVFVIMLGVLCAILYPLAKEAIDEARKENSKI